MHHTHHQMREGEGGGVRYRVGEGVRYRGGEGGLGIGEGRGG